MTRSWKVQRKILKKYPSAKLREDCNRNLYIEINGINVSEQNLFPPAKDIDTAWFQADMSLKITQNINRTHPLKLANYSSDDTKKRINGRREKNKKRKETEYSIGYDYDQQYE